MYEPTLQVQRVTKSRRGTWSVIGALVALCAACDGSPGTENDDVSLSGHWLGAWTINSSTCQDIVNGAVRPVQATLVQQGSDVTLELAHQQGGFFGTLEGKSNQANLTLTGELNTLSCELAGSFSEDRIRATMMCAVPACSERTALDLFRDIP